MGDVALVVVVAQCSTSIGVLLTTSNAQMGNGDLLSELRDLFPEEPIIRRTGVTNAYEDPTFREALESTLTTTGRTHVILAGVTIGTGTMISHLVTAQRRP